MTRAFRPTRLLRSASLVLSLLGASAAAQADTVVDPAWVVARLAQPVPSQTPFVELRQSPMLKQQLQVSGQYRRPDAQTLVREVSRPYQETATIAGGQVRLQRAGRSPRVFALDRAPELASLQDSFAALLGGDLARLQQAFQLSSSGSRAQWRLVLTPRAPTLAARLRRLTLLGSGDQLRCIQTEPVQGQPQQTLVGPAAEAALARGLADADALQALCRGAVS